MTTDEYRAVIGEARGKAGRAMSRLNKLAVPNSVTQQRLYTEAQDYLSELLDLLLSAQLRLDDEEWDESEPAHVVAKRMGHGYNSPPPAHKRKG